MFQINEIISPILTIVSLCIPSLLFVKFGVIPAAQFFPWKNECVENLFSCIWNSSAHPPLDASEKAGIFSLTFMEGDTTKNN
ncbi:MAG: hypothetical protein OEV89_06345 [Desulfobulbaceae bacterium]|nr:hypothetical protein [Desulfobulbaceae bacterium]HIJ90371.1 hypothetical protein [Deltaproteobacteria bacterium]